MRSSAVTISQSVGFGVCYLFILVVLVGYRGVCIGRRYGRHAADVSLPGNISESYTILEIEELDQSLAI